MVLFLAIKELILVIIFRKIHRKHQGYITIIKAARSLCRLLIVLLNYWVLFRYLIYQPDIKVSRLILLGD